MIPPESEPDIHEACAHWLEYLVRDRRLAVTSVTTYRSALRLTFVGLSDLPSTSELGAAIDQRLAHPSGHVRRASFVALSQFFRWWEKRGGPPNPLADARVPPKPSSRRSALTTAELAILEDRLALARPKERAEVLLMLRCGFRVGDVVSLQVEDIDFAAATIRCRDGKGGTDAVIPMTEGVAAALEQYLATTGITSGVVFTGPKGQMRPQAVWKCWKRVAGPELAHHAAHQLRNTFANELARQGTNLNTVRRLMRHSSLNTTQRYLDDDAEAERQAVRSLEGLSAMRPRAVAFRPTAQPAAAPEPPPTTPPGDLGALRNRSDLRFILERQAGQKQGWAALHRWLLRRLQADPQMGREPIWVTAHEWMPSTQDVPVHVSTEQRPWMSAIYEVEPIPTTWGQLFAIAAEVVSDEVVSGGQTWAGWTPTLA